MPAAVPASHRTW